MDDRPVRTLRTLLVPAAGLATPPHRTPASGQAHSSLLGAWTALAIAGAAFAKISEHFDTALPNSTGNAAEIAWRTTEIAAIAAALAVLTGAVIALPASSTGLARRALRAVCACTS